MTTTAEPPTSGISHEASELLRPYVPRLVIDWLRTDPDALHRELEASLVFVDISGFTALTERLARKGKVGAELMRDTLDGVFTALLDEAYDWGAGLLKWGGDALLLSFDGPSHAWRACRAAWEMQRTIDRVGRLQVSGGTITLRMSVGIGTGRYHFFMTGSVHRELLIAGPAMTETLTMEAIADAGEIGISPTLAALLHPSWVGPQKDGITLLGAPPEIDRERAPNVGDVRGLDIASCIPVAARAHVLLRKSEPEHRTITAAFIDMVDTDRILEERGPEALGRGLDERMRAIQETALEYEVPFYETDVGKSSVKALLTAGAPSSTGHDEERMLRTLRQVMDRPGLVPMRIGVNTGKVFTGDFGPPYRRAYRVFGDAINTAARVTSKAEPGQILSTEIVLDRSRTIFATTPIPPFAAKGKAEPVRASIVGPATGVKASHRGGQALIGRDREIETLMVAIERARGSAGTIVEIIGEPGIGKTRIVEELAARSPDFRLVHARCEEYEASTPYFAFRSIVRDVIGLDGDADTDVVSEALRAEIQRIDPSLEPWTPLLGILLGLDMPDTPETAALDERFLRERLAEVAIRFMGTSLSGAATIFLIEDIDHLDEASHDLLLRLAQAAADRRQVLIVTREGSAAPFAPADRGLPEMISLELGPLAKVDLLAIVDASTEHAPLPRHVVEEVARRSGGNALFLFELINAVRATGSLESLPDSIESMIAAEIDRLTPTDRTILRYAAVLGSSFDPALLAQAVSDDVDLGADVWTRLAGLVIREATGAVRFRNTLVRDAAYEGLPYRRRRVLHGRVGEAIEAQAGMSLEEEIGTLALHYVEAQRWDKAWIYSRKAADRALGMYANVEAVRSYEAALTAGRRLRGVTRADLAAIQERIGDVRYNLYQPDLADTAYKAARGLIEGDPAGAARLALKQAKQSTSVGRYPLALRRMTRALRALDGVAGDAAGAARARLFVWYGWTRFLQNRTAEAIAWCRRGADEAQRAGADDALAYAYQLLDAALTEHGEIDQATNSRLALQIYERLGDLAQQAITLNNMGVIAKERSDWSESRHLYDRAQVLFEATGDRGQESMAKYNIAEILSDQGHAEEAAALLREVIRVWRASGAETDVAEARRELARAMARSGHGEAALSLLAEARATQEAHSLPGEVLATDARTAEVLAMAGRSTDALRLAEQTLRVVDGVDGRAVVAPTLHRVRGWARLQMGAGDAANEAFGIALELARARDDTFQEALALEGLIVVAEAAGSEGPKASNLALWRARRDAIQQQLGIVASLPIPQATTA